VSGAAGRSLLLAGVVAGAQDDVRVVDTLAGPATRVRRRVTASLEGRELPAEVVQYAIATPSGAAPVLLSFSTPLVEAADAFVELFDSVAASTTWVR
jgi:hypothetical protein